MVYLVEMKDVRREFRRLLTEDSKTKDARRRGFNQAIFSAESGHGVFNNTSLDMVMEKFDAAVKNVAGAAIKKEASK